MVEQTITVDTTRERNTQAQKVPTAQSIFFKATLLSLVFAFILLCITAFGLLGFAYYKLTVFAQKAGTSVPELKTLVQNALQTTPEQTDGYKTILLLGIDSVSNKPNSPELTDTILLLSLDMNSGNIRMLSLPRDLWSSAYQTRINALYEYGKERYPERPEQFPEEVISELSGVPIEHTVTLSLNTVAQIIDILGGVEVAVAQGFTDTEFPREDVDLTTAKTQAELYETVIFEEGVQHMDGPTTLKYIRSRKSANLEQGTDTARSERQQQVLAALVKKAQSFSLLKESEVLADLYVLYTNTFESQFSKLEALATLNHLLPYLDTVELNAHTLSIYPETETGVITNPPLSKYKGQWVYEIRELESFRAEIATVLRK